MSKFDTVKFLNLLADDCAAHEVKGEQFTADPSKLGPLLMTAANRFAEQAHLTALLENRWVVARSPEDKRWRVWSADTGAILDNQAAGSESRLEAVASALPTA